MKKAIIDIIEVKQRYVLRHKEVDGDTKNITHAFLGDVANEIVLTDFTCSTCKFWNQTADEIGFCKKGKGFSFRSMQLVESILRDKGLLGNDIEEVKNEILGGLRTDKDFGCINHIGDCN